VIVVEGDQPVGIFTRRRRLRPLHAAAQRHVRDLVVVDAATPLQDIFEPWRTTHQRGAGGRRWPPGRCHHPKGALRSTLYTPNSDRDGPADGVAIGINTRR
jgi:hypothetical protein